MCHNVALIWSTYYALITVRILNLWLVKSSKFFLFLNSNLYIFAFFVQLWQLLHCKQRWKFWVLDHPVWCSILPLMCIFWWKWLAFNVLPNYTASWTLNRITKWLKTTNSSFYVMFTDTLSRHRKWRHLADLKDPSKAYFRQLL